MTDRAQPLDPAVERDPLGRRRPRDLATSVPAIISLGVGALYAVGVVYQLNALRGVGIHATQAFPLISLEDHLARGLAVVLSPRTLLFILIGVAAAVVMSPAAGPMIKRLSASGMWKRARLIVGVPVAAVALAFALFEPWPLALQLVVLLIIYVPLMLAFLERGVGYIRAVVLGIVVSLAVSNGVMVYADPPPLEAAVVHLKRGEPVRGSYIATRDDTVVLAVREGRSRRIPVHAVRLVDLAPRGPREQAPTLLDLVGSFMASSRWVWQTADK